LRAATNVNADPTPQEEQFLDSLDPPRRPTLRRVAQPSFARQPFLWKSILQWRVAVPAFGLLLMLAAFLAINISPSGPLAGSRFAQFAVATHRQHFQGALALDVLANSQQVLNEWFKDNVPFSLHLPASPPLPDENSPYRLNGARLVRFRAKSAAFVAYQADAGAISLMVAPNSVAVAAGGVEVPFKKVRFHYRNVEGYKVVTWSAQGLTYALVSQEGNRTQKSCMVCHAAMRDRDLTNTPAPLPENAGTSSGLWQ
jgi:anti-sigma factor RsiW